MSQENDMKENNTNISRRQQLAEFINLSADYIGVKPPSEHTFARWTTHCSCQQNRAETRAS
ncbi:MAG: hypothetical protein OQL17_00925 [Sedimenticola sp.]|uniref:Uncharacterized protein n=1 Tax=Sedimenticola thiotaurini TaxID=1543721 RepID=A0A558DC68_9GAMM|nr:hypothetical protein [Sedimenticola sp.]TVT58624.1 MAG: hypothetical protein FHK82_04460 [Sedimenticola thiotaurini]MCW8920930.1 hypothetical protein [Sedimenticola sp.]MCW8948149.1 hypothetical protein [Sedimenticola sp.]MCW8948514.1 hypothetical protein [Sedimenticola sp.]